MNSAHRVGDVKDERRPPKRRERLAAYRHFGEMVDGAEIELLYLGAPKYRVKVVAPDYKTAEKALEKAASAAIGVMERAEGAGKLVRKQK